MKKNYQTFCVAVTLFVVMAFRAAAQLSGIVTVDSSLPTSGSVFQSFSALAAVLNTAGISAPLTVNVTAGSGPYNEQVNFLQTPGISSTNTITINGNGCTISFTAAAAATAWTMLFSGADYITVNNLNIVGAGAAQALTCHLWNGADNNRFNNCTFTAPMVGTGTGLVPLSISGTSISGTSTGNSGSNNIINTCTISGGYYNTVFTGATAAPFNTGNQLLNSVVKDFYIYGFYNGYSVNSVVRSNVVERPNRTTISTGYGIYLTTGSVNSLVERNHVRRLADGSLGSTSALYAIYVLADASLNNENVIRNNLVSDLKSNGTQAGIYFTGPAYANAYHNTIVLDDATSTAGTTYGIYCTGPSNKLKNNLVSISRAGSGTKYCVYLSTAATNLDCNYNVLFINSIAGANYTGYLSTAYATLSTWQAGTGNDMSSTDADPVFTNPSLLNYLPTSIAVNNLCAPVGVILDFNNTGRSPVFPDPGAFEMFNTPCNSAPSANSFVTPTIALCPGTTQNFFLTSTNTYTNAGYTIQWYDATASNLGPYTAAANGTLNSFTTLPINFTTYYVAVITCSNGGASYTTAPGQVNVSPTTTNTVPYYESFETLSLNDLPNCSWVGTSMGGATNTYTSVNTSYRVPRTGNNYAAFSNAPAGINYFYSNGVWLNPGITYSAAIWFIHDIANVNNWTDLSIMIGQLQNPAAMTQVATTNGTLAPSLYTLLSNTFTIASPGLYYVGVRATAGAGVAPYLTWDDLSITIPCEINGPPMQVAASLNTICSNQPVNLTAFGANSYSWNTGQTVSSIVVSPSVTTTYTVSGLNAISGCSKSIAKTIVVKPSPQIAAFANDPVSCPGEPVTVSAQGAFIYSWSNGGSGSTTVVSPSITTTYSVIGTSTLSCSSMATIEVVVNPSPNVSATASSTMFCAGEPITFKGTGALTYQWMTSSNSVLFGDQLIIFPLTSSTYTLIGTDANGCEGVDYISFGVEECTGINEINAGMVNVDAWPNPTTGMLNIRHRGISTISFDVTDITGRLILSKTSESDNTLLDLTSIANGVYYLKAHGDNFVDVIKIVKQ